MTGLTLCCVAFIVVGLSWLLLFSVKTEPKVDLRLDNTRMLNGTGVDPAGQMFKQCAEGSPNCLSQPSDEESDYDSEEHTTRPRRRKRRFAKST